MDFFMGVCHPRKRLDLMKQAGVQWLRCDMPFPFEGEVGKASQRFRNFHDQVSAWNREGFKVMGITPYPRGWQVDAGAPGSAGFLDIYQEACRFLAQELGDMVPGWQISNELNLESFRHPLTEEQAIAFAKRGGLGICSWGCLSHYLICRFCFITVRQCYAQCPSFLDLWSI